jgi:hypothetical protein
VGPALLGESGATPLGSGKAELMPPGSDEVEPALWGLDEAAVVPLNCPSELIVNGH